jgi:alanyl-tRNA synthetase
MQSSQIRQEFLDFFAERGHEVRPSASLIPIDPTLLLTNAGMVPFKPYFLGEEQPPFDRAVSAQKVARTVDIEVVGTTVRHFTFFEMLGNFSFGDYFKEKAIPWAFEFSTERLGLDPERLWFTVHESDDEASEIWLDVVGVDPKRLQRRGRDNFWQMGVPGPCGPSSEIFYDRGPEHGPEGGPVVDEERFCEFWNLVFMQFVQEEPYNVVGDLPARSIDTGMGLERVAMLLQRVGSVFETDAVSPVLQAGAAYAGARYGESPEVDVALRILADHGRSVTMLIADGVVPSNDGRGYVLRRILRRAVRHAWRLGGEGLVMPRLVRATVEALGAGYPELAHSEPFVVDVVEREEARFRRTLESGSELLDAELDRLQPGGQVSGTTAFKLHDTYGFPVEVTIEVAAERGLGVDSAGFDQEMQVQRERARASWKGGVASGVADTYRRLLDDTGPTEFLGYRDEAAPGRILALLRGGEAAERADEGEEVEVFVDRTPFYAEAGGQVGDTGMIETETGSLEVADTQGPVPALHGHRAKVRRGFVQVGQEAQLSIDSPRRERIRKSHTGTHILHWSLRDVLGDHVRQAGSLVEAGRLRFDFSHFKAVDPEELAEVELRANRRTVENAAVSDRVTSKQEAERIGALAFFGDKYGEQVRVVRIGDYSVELCGGTHTPSAGQVGPLLVIGESSIGSNLRRIEALSGDAAYDHMVSARRTLGEAGALLRARPDEVPGRIRALQEQARRLEERLGSLADRERAEDAAGLAEEADTVGERQLVVAERELDPAALRALALAVRDRLQSGAVVLGTRHNGKGALVAVVTADLTASGISAADLAAAGARLLGGGGSRDPELSQAGGPHGERLAEALEAARDAAGRALVS